MNGFKFFVGMLLFLLLIQPAVALDNAFYQTRQNVKALLNTLKPYRTQNHNIQLARIAQALTDTPYRDHSTGEGDWQPRATTYQPGALHIHPQPIYRLDVLDCQTFVQVGMALLYSQNLVDFDRNYLKITYGAAGNPQGEIVHFYNRNHFVDGDFNPINRKNGWFIDITSGLSPYTAYASAKLSRQNWFRLQQNVRVSSPSMAKRYRELYLNLPFPRFQSEDISISYIPKKIVALLQPDGTYLPNQALLEKIPTPAIIEIVSDVKKWNYAQGNIKDIIGTELNVPHFGFLFRKTFQRGEPIYQRVICEYNNQRRKICDVKTITCEKNVCHELMMAHATRAYPNNYYWYQEENGTYTCSATKPHHSHYTYCNRVEQIPLFDYLTAYSYGYYPHMQNPAILGIHLEKLS